MAANPYVQGWREWDDRYADLVQGKRNWQIVTAVFSLLTLILAVAIVWLITRSRYVCYVVEVDKLGYALTAPRPLIPSTEPALIERMERYEVASFIRDARTVSSDPGTEQHQLDDLLAHTRGAANRFLDAYYHSDNFLHNPFKIAEHKTVAVQIDSILELSAHSYQVRWSEQAHDLTGAPVGAPNHWEAALETRIVAPNSDDSIISNPLGFFVTQISWTEQQS